jgi:hypothetical protein
MLNNQKLSAVGKVSIREIARIVEGAEEERDRQDRF